MIIWGQQWSHAIKLTGERERERSGLGMDCCDGTFIMNTIKLFAQYYFLAKRVPTPDKIKNFKARRPRCLFAKSSKFLLPLIANSINVMSLFQKTNLFGTRDQFFVSL